MRFTFRRWRDISGTTIPTGGEDVLAGPHDVGASGFREGGRGGLTKVGPEELVRFNILIKCTAPATATSYRAINVSTARLWGTGSEAWLRPKKCSLV